MKAIGGVFIQIKTAAVAVPLLAVPVAERRSAPRQTEDRQGHASAIATSHRHISLIVCWSKDVGKMGRK